LPGGSPCFAAIWTATGINSASAPTLFMKPERTAPSAVKAAIVTTGEADPGSTIRVSASTAPEDCKPLLRIRTQATVMTAG
jgi:hypothetical protein